MRKNIIRLTTSIMKPVVVDVVDMLTTFLILINPDSDSNIFKFEKLERT